ncbi:MAG TPA: TatD family hydrolase, partial [Marmoricola sp.]
GLPLVIHTRSASADTLAVLREEMAATEQGAGAVRGVFHCFTETMEVAMAALELGFHISFSGILTFKNAEPLRAALRATPLDRVLVETDAPYLTPMPYRGRPNASYLVPLTVRSMAGTRGDDLATLCRAIEANTDRAFGGGWGPAGDVTDGTNTP